MTETKPMKTLYVLLALGLALGGAAMVPTAAAWCVHEDDPEGDLYSVTLGGCPNNHVEVLREGIP